MMRNARSFKILLRNDRNKLLDLNYTLIQNPSAQIWFECLKSAAEKSSIKSTRFYNFKNRTEQTPEILVQQLENTISALAPFLPELVKSELRKESDSELQKSLNELHTKFSDTHIRNLLQ